MISYNKCIEIYLRQTTLPAARYFNYKYCIAVMCNKQFSLFSLQLRIGTTFWKIKFSKYMLVNKNNRFSRCIVLLSKRGTNRSQNTLLCESEGCESAHNDVMTPTTGKLTSL